MGTGGLSSAVEVKTTHSSGQFLALLAFEQQSGHLLASSFVRGLNRNLALVLLVLVVNRTEPVVGVGLLMLGLCFLCSGVPNLLLCLR